MKHYYIALMICSKIEAETAHGLIMYPCLPK